jgi:hypothetical protein
VQSHRKNVRHPHAVQAAISNGPFHPDPELRISHPELSQCKSVCGARNRAILVKPQPSPGIVKQGQSLCAAHTPETREHYYPRFFPDSCRLTHYSSIGPPTKILLSHPLGGGIDRGSEIIHLLIGLGRRSRLSQHGRCGTITDRLSSLRASATKRPRPKGSPAGDFENLSEEPLHYDRVLLRIAVHPLPETALPESKDDTEPARGSWPSAYSHREKSAA